MVTASATLELVLPDGSVRTVESGATPLDVARSIGPRLAKDAIGALIDGEMVDLRQPLSRGGRIEIVTAKSPRAGDFVRHSAEHVLADAVKRLFPDVEIDAGRKDHSEKFQYDFRIGRPFTPEDLERIEEQMRAIVGEDSSFERIEVSRDEAKRLFAEMGETLKVQRLDDIPDGETITLYRHGRFTDLCRGPHVQRASQIGAMKLLDASGVYLRGDESAEMLQRIYGTAFATPAELESYLQAIEQARARDHRRIGVELDLFSFNPLAPAMPFFHPKGAFVYNRLMRFVRDLQDGTYGEVVTPQILDVDLWHTSGHYDNYREAMFFTEADERQMAVKPMNCPGHCLIFATRLRSYRDLPIRYGDFGRLHRYEKSGVTSGLTRVRSFSQDDAHIFCTEEQIGAEVEAAARMILEIYRTLGFSAIKIELSTRPEKSIGTKEQWDHAESTLKAALESLPDIGRDYQINEGDGAFYGPKIDFQISDALGRWWQLGTIQLDYQMPERFGLKYVGADGAEHRPAMLHRAMLGSLERFLGILIEHTSGAFPVWLMPVQAIVLPVSEKFADYATSARDQLAAAGVRVELDDRGEKLGYKIREAQLQRIPYMLVVGGREAEGGTVAVRLRTGEDLGAMPVADVAARIAGRELARSLEL